MELDTSQRRALQLLADAGQRGATEAVLIARGFTAQMLFRFIRWGLATAKSEARSVEDDIFEVVRARITNAGRLALDR